MIELAKRYGNGCIYFFDFTHCSSAKAAERVSGLDSYRLVREMLVYVTVTQILSFLLADHAMARSMAGTLAHPPGPFFPGRPRTAFVSVSEPAVLARRAVGLFPVFGPTGLIGLETEAIVWRCCRIE